MEYFRKRDSGSLGLAELMIFLSHQRVRCGDANANCSKIELNNNVHYYTLIKFTVRFVVSYVTLRLCYVHSIFIGCRDILFAYVSPLGLQ